MMNRYVKIIQSSDVQYYCHIVIIDIIFHIVIMMSFHISIYRHIVIYRNNHVHNGIFISMLYLVLQYMCHQC